jgi:hypothetical protein
MYEIDWHDCLPALMQFEKIGLKYRYRIWLFLSDIIVKGTE